MTFDRHSFSRHFTSSFPVFVSAALILGALALIGFEPPNAHAQDSTTVEVSGAAQSYSFVNGSYTCVKNMSGDCESFNGYAKYEKDSNPDITIQWDDFSFQWEIQESSAAGPTSTYYKADTTDQLFRPPEEGWDAGFDGTPPAPSLSYGAGLSAQTGEASAVTASSVQLNGRVLTTNSTTVEFEYWPTGAVDTQRVAATQSPISDTSDVSAKATTGVSAETEYKFRVTASNDGGAVQGNTRTFTTPSVGGSGSFITKWESQLDPVVESSQRITIYTNGEGAPDYNFTVHWGDGTSGTYSGNDPDPTHKYDTAPDTFTVIIEGTFPRIDLSTCDGFNSPAIANSDQLVSIEQWGDMQWTSMYCAFGGANRMVSNATDTPDLSNVTSTKEMFAGADEFNGEMVPNWDVSNVTNMEAMFRGADVFDQDIGGWDVSNVTDMSEMFSFAGSFNQDLDSWDVSKVTDMEKMFFKANAFNGKIGSWEVSKVTNMRAMFQETNFDRDLGEWDVSSVTNMGAMFYGSNVRNIANWDVSSVTNMSEMFRLSGFNEDIGNWDVSNVSDMSGMFKSAQFNQDIGEWDVSNVTTMNDIFAGTAGLDPTNYDALLIGWSRRDLPDGVTFNASDLKYSPAAADDRQEISSDDNWTFNDGGVEDTYPVPSLTGGSSYDPPTPTSGTDDNPVGRLKMDVNDFAYGAVIDRLVLTANGSDQGVKAVSVWNSSQSTFDAGTAQRLTEKSLDPTTEVPPTLTMTDLDQMLPSNGSTYFYVTYDLASDASVDGDLLLADSTDATLYRAVVSNAATTFPLALSSSTTTPSTVSSKTVSGDTTATFGDTGSTLNFSGVSTSGGVTVSRYDEGPSNTDGISESNVSSYRLTIDADSDLSFNSAQVQFAVSMLPGISDPDAVTIYKRDTEGSGSFNALTTTVGDNNTPDDVTDDTLYASTTSFSEFAIASDSQPLPVEMAGFDAQVDDGSVQLSWTTTSETNNAGFRIQRRVGAREREGKGDGERGGGKAWTTVGKVDGAGTTSQPQSYRYTDGDLPFEADALTYRLKQVDADGSASFSETVTVERGVTEVQLLGTYPNPARRQATVRYALPEKQETTIRLYDVLGRRVRTVVSEKKEGRHEQTLEVSGLSNGVYFLRLRSGGTIKTQKLTIVR